MRIKLPLTPAEKEKKEGKRRPREENLGMIFIILVKSCSLVFFV